MWKGHHFVYWRNALLTSPLALEKFGRGRPLAVHFPRMFISFSYYKQVKMSQFSWLCVSLLLLRCCCVADIVLFVCSFVCFLVCLLAFFYLLNFLLVPLSILIDYTFVLLYVSLFVCFFVCLFVSPSVCMFVCLSVCLFICSFASVFGNLQFLQRHKNLPLFALCSSSLLDVFQGQAIPLSEREQAPQGNPRCFAASFQDTKVINRHFHHFHKHQLLPQLFLAAP